MPSAIARHAAGSTTTAVERGSGTKPNRASARLVIGVKPIA
jgi:hypothetical protein